METQTTFQQGNDIQRSEICPFRRDIHEGIAEYASAPAYEDFLTLLQKVFSQLDMGQIFRNIAGE
ncbi:MAG: hypothetical protein LUH15_05655 [Tannerellaceae bacterium]|nr:hypothetical protein [Tannerellaceae bacterium]